MNLLPEIRFKINSWLENGTGRSSAMLARLAGLPYSTTRRVVQGESISTCVNLANILSVVLENNDAHLLGSLLKEQFPNETSVIETFISKGLISDDSRQKLNRFINDDPISSVIYAICNSDIGVSADEIENEYGRAGMRALDNLINAELVEQAGGKFKTSTDRKVNFTVQSFKNALKGHVDNMLFENLEENLAFGYIQWGTISKEAYCQALVALKKNMQEIESLITNNPGNIPIYFLSLGNSYVDLKSFTEREKRKNEKN